MRWVVLSARLDGGRIGVAGVISDIVKPVRSFAAVVVVAMSESADFAMLLPMLEVRVILKCGEMELKPMHDA